MVAVPQIGGRHAKEIQANEQMKRELMKQLQKLS